ncbi:MAG: hypothetical protein JSW33_07870 [bacterium]|nr:MAG: hypothetical protein JSW33_07870 [bacterium]
MSGFLRYFARNGKLGNSAMVYRIIFVLFCILPASFLFAQTDNLNINVNRMSPESSDWEATFSWQSSANLQGGLILELSDNIQVVPASVRIDDQEMWLKRGLEIPANDSVVCWEASEEGLILLFRESRITNNSRLQVRCHAAFIPTASDTALVQLREVRFRSGQTETLDAALAEGTIPNISTFQEN